MMVVMAKPMVMVMVSEPSSMMTSMMSPGKSRSVWHDSCVIRTAWGMATRRVLVTIPIVLCQTSNTKNGQVCLYRRHCAFVTVKTE